MVVESWCPIWIFFLNLIFNSLLKSLKNEVILKLFLHKGNPQKYGTMRPLTHILFLDQLLNFFWVSNHFFQGSNHWIIPSIFSNVAPLGRGRLFGSWNLIFFKWAWVNRRLGKFKGFEAIAGAVLSIGFTSAIIWGGKHEMVIFKIHFHGQMLHQWVHYNK